MSVPMKKLPIELELRIENQTFKFQGISLEQARALVVSLKKYQAETVLWRETTSQRFKNQGGESAYMIRAARKNAGMTQVELAEKLKIPQANLSQIETGKRVVGKGLAKKLAEIFRMDYRVFL